MKQVRKRLTYANVVATLALFLVVAGGSAFAAGQLAKNSVGPKQLKKNAVTSAKIKKDAVTAAKIKKAAVTAEKIKPEAVTAAQLQNGAVTGAKIANGAVTGDKVNLATLGPVPVSTTTQSVRSGAGTLPLGQEKTIFEYGPVKITMKCEEYAGTQITSRFYISSSTTNTVFTSWRDVGSHLGPDTPEEDRELSAPTWAPSSGEFEGEPPFDTGGSALTAGGQAFNFWIGEGAEKDTGTCWYWLSANIIS